MMEKDFLDYNTTIPSILDADQRKEKKYCNLDGEIFFSSSFLYFIFIYL